LSTLLLKKNEAEVRRAFLGPSFHLRHFLKQPQGSTFFVKIVEISEKVQKSLPAPARR
jgi:hypothetical protein